MQQNAQPEKLIMNNQPAGKYDNDAKDTSHLV